MRPITRLNRARRSKFSSRDFEILESRICLTALPTHDSYNAPSPFWFAAASRLAESASIAFSPPLDSQPPSMVEPTWIVRLNADSTKLIDHLSQASDLLNSDDAAIEVIRGLGLPGQLLVRSDESSIQVVEKSLAANKHVAYFDRNDEVRGQQVPDDPKFSQQYALQTIDTPAAWDRTIGSTEVVVGVIDSGVDVSHPDLFLNIWINPGEIPSEWRAVLDVNQDGQVTFYDLNDLDLDLTSLGKGEVLAQFVSDLNQNGYVDAHDLLMDEHWADGEDTDGNGLVDDLVGWNFRTGELGNSPSDSSGHGTHVAGTIGAIGANREGVTGINWRSSIMPLKFLGSDLNGMVADAVEAVNYATMMHTKYHINIPVLNNSWTTEDACTCLLDAIRSSEAAGMLFVAAAGNKFGISSSAFDNDQRPIYPASFDVPNVISVAASDSADNLADFSHFGRRSVDLAAPGAGIVSTNPSDAVRELSRNGTSMAAAQVSGVAALVAARRPEATAAGIRAAILQGADFVPGLNGKVAGGRRLNALGALQVDTFAPVPELVGAPNINVESENPTVVQINYRDDSAVRTASIDERDIRVVTSGGGNALEVRFLDSGLPIPSPKLAQYQVLPPGGSWDAGDNGVYRVELLDAEVSDEKGNTATGAVLGSFEVLIGPPGQFLVDKINDTVDSNLNDDQCLDASSFGEGCSLRAAVMQANNDPGDNVIFLPAGNLQLSLVGPDDTGLAGDLDVLGEAGTLTVRGSTNGSTTIDAQQLDRVFHVHPGATLILDGVSLTGGEALNGGAVLVENGGTLQIRNSTVYENHAEEHGGGIYIAGVDAELLVQNSTISSNEAGESGGGVSAWSSADVTVENTTVAHNAAGLSAGGVGAISSEPSVHNSIIAGNSAPTDPDVTSTFVSLGYNLIGDVGSAVGFGAEGDIVGDTEEPTDALLSELRDNAGRALTHVPLLGSPAIDNGTLLFVSDQRGIPRPQDGDANGSERPDIGAVERYFAEIGGVKYHDRNENGRRDVDDFGALEPGIKGWTIYLDLNEDGLLNVGEPATLTAADGSYAFRNLDPSRTYTVAEVQQSGWRQTGPVEKVPEPSDGKFLVNTETDSVDVNPGDGLALDANDKTSLRAAIMEANALPDEQTVEIPPGNFSLPLGELTVTDSLTIVGSDPGITVIQAGDASRIFHVKNADLQMEGVTLTGGRCMTAGVCEDGGAIFSTGFLDILYSEFLDNQAIGSGGAIFSTATTIIGTSQFVGNSSSTSAGAVYVSESDLGIRDSEFSKNESQSGGAAAAVGGSARLTVANVTFFENSGGISAPQGSTLVFNSTFSGNREQFAIDADNAPLTIVNSTITANSGGGVQSLAGTAQVGNTIIAANTTDGSLDIAGQFVSLGHNLIGNGDTATGFVNAADGDQVGGEQGLLDPRLAPLDENGGFGLTHALLPDSPAIDRGKDAILAEVPADVGELRLPKYLDQRNEARFADGDEDGVITIDIGAYEFPGRSAIIVQTSEDTVGGESVSLRDAIIQANGREGHDTIILLEEIYELSRSGVAEDADETGDLDIRDDLTIIGSGATVTIIDAMGIDRVLDIADANVTITGLTIRGGNATSEALSKGGGIKALDSAITVSNSTITSNSAKVGGGIYSSGGSVILTDTNVTRNSALSENQGTGGGIHNAVNSTLEVRNSIISENESVGGGGGIHDHGGSVLIVDTQLHGNSAGQGGGAISNRGEMQIHQSDISGNVSSYFGGGISNAGILQIKDSLISGNEAFDFAGGIANFDAFDLSNSTVSNNTALRNGGGIHVSASEVASAPLTISQSTIAFNTVTSGTANGGGVYVTETTAFPVTIENSIIANNAGVTDIEGEFISLGHNLIGNPGSVHAFADDTNGDLVGTSAAPLDARLTPLSDNGGTTFTHAPLAGSAAIDAGARDSATVTDQRGFSRPFDGDFDGHTRSDIGAVEYTPARPRFIVNSVEDTVDANPGDGVAADSAGMTTLRAAVMEANELPGIDVIQLPEDTITLSIAGAGEDNALSGDLDVLDALVIVGEGKSFSTIIGQTGDRIFDVRDEDLLLRGIGIGAEGVVEGNGGLLRADGGSLELHQVGISGGNASEGGGAIFATGADVVIEDSELTETSAENGGSIYATGENTAVRISRSGFFGNSAINGGAIFFDHDAKLNVENSSFSDNVADGGVGGAIGVNLGEAKLNFVTITSNEADTGGGIWNFDVRFHISNSIVSGNTGSTGQDVDGRFESTGYNWIGVARASNGFGNLDFFGSSEEPRDPLLATSSAVNNGGPTRTHALSPGSPAIDAASPVEYPLLDQRTSRRNMDGNGDEIARPDIGAHEYFDGFFVDRLDDSADANPGDGQAVDDQGRTSLRAAIMEANSLDSHQLVVLAPGTHELSLAGAQGDLDILDDLTLMGVGASETIVDANGIDRVFELARGATATFRELGITGGHASGLGARANGGGIYSEGVLNLIAVDIFSNHADNSGGGAASGNESEMNLLLSSIRSNSAGRLGGGIHANASSNLDLRQSSVTDNVAGTDGGGLYSNAAGVVANSTLSGNRAQRGGGIFAEEAIGILSSSLVRNRADLGGGIFSVAGATLGNSLVAENVADIDPDVSGTFTSFRPGINLIGLLGNASGFANMDLVGSDTPLAPKIGPLVTIGSVTRLHKLLPGSIAIDAGAGGGPEAVDQRGRFDLPRVADGNGDGKPVIDIGAFELQPDRQLVQAESKAEPVRSLSADASVPQSAPKRATASSAIARAEAAGPTPTGAWTIQPDVGEIIAGADFGNRALPGGISGSVFDDRNRDSFRNETEPLLPDWIVVIRTPEGETLQQSSTDVNGRFAFQNLQSMSTYIVTVEDQPQWISGRELEVFVGAGESLEDVNIANRQVEITGAGALLGGRVALAGNVQVGRGNRTVFADENDNGVLDTNEPFDITRADGSYQLSVDRLPVNVRLLLAPEASLVSPAPQFKFDRLTQPANAAPFFVTAADLDLDGDQDLILAQQETATLLLLLNNGDGTFEYGATLELAENTYARTIAAADLDGDRDLELVAAGSSGVVSVFWNQGPSSLGTFSTAVPIMHGGIQASSLVTGDFDENDFIDVAVVSQFALRSGPGNVSILLNDGAGNLAKDDKPIVVGIQPFSIAAGGFDDDVFQDLAVVNSASASISILVNDKAGDFVLAENISFSGDANTDGAPLHVVAGRLNADEHLDLAVTFAFGTVKLLWGDGAGGFTIDDQPLSTGDLATSILAVDLNGDQSLDLVVTDVQSKLVTVFQNDGNGRFRADDPINGVGPLDPPSFSVAAADLNGDGTTDLALAHTSADPKEAVSLLFNRIAPGGYVAITETNQFDFLFTEPDSVPPTVAVDQLLTINPRPELSGAIDDPNATIRLVVAGDEYSAINNGQGRWILPAGEITPALIDGLHDVRVVATDPQGNVGEDVTVNELTVDTTAPKVTFDQQSSVDRRPVLQGTVDDPLAVIEITIDPEGEAAIGPLFARNRGRAWNLDRLLFELSPGQHVVRIAARDPAENVEPKDFTIHIRETIIAPSVTVNDPSGGEVVSEGNALIVSWRVAGPPIEVDVLFSANGPDGDFDYLYSGPSNIAFQWKNFPSIATDDAYLKVVAYGEGGMEGVDVSDRAFTLTWAGDTDVDLDVDFADFLALAANFGTQQNATRSDGDANGDGAVSFQDFLVLAVNFGRSRTP